MNISTVYVKLLDEGIDVYRPIQAEARSNGSFIIKPTPDYDPEDEKWEFLPGQNVICEKIKLAGGVRLVAMYLAS